MAHMDFDFTTPKGLEITLNGEKKDKSNKTGRQEDQERGEKKTDIPVKFYVVYFLMRGKKTLSRAQFR